jgi:hexosaminidase
MKRYTKGILFCVICLGGLSFAQAVWPVIPEPFETEPGEGVFVLTCDTVIAAKGDAESTGHQLADMLNPATGFSLKVEPEMPQGRQGIRLWIDERLNEFGPEGYWLVVKPKGVYIRAFKQAGLFYACQSLRQLMPAEILKSEKTDDVWWTVTCVNIFDKPRFSWRGLMMDCSRTFWSKEYIKRYIDLLAFYKLNVLHLHLTDDQGWRVEIKSHPELTEVCSKFDPKYNEPPERQGFYTQADIREIVSYAKARKITIVPEIEMPGHCTEVFAAYPQLSCSGEKSEIYPFFKGPGITEQVYCAGNEKVFEFLEDVLDEVIELFPGRYIHIGGDECPKESWKQCPKCQKRIKDENLSDEHELQSYFVKRIEKYLTGKGRVLIGWDEILEGGLAPRAAVMSWRGTAGGIAAAKAGHEVVMSPTSHCYFDYDNKKYSLENVYSFEPIPPQLSTDEQSFILGAQANMWTHIARTEDEVDVQIFPRLIALAEVCWSAGNQRHWKDFSFRLRHHYPRLEMLGVKYYKDSP